MKARLICLRWSCSRVTLCWPSRGRGELRHQPGFTKQPVPPSIIPISARLHIQTFTIIRRSFRPSHSILAKSSRVFGSSSRMQSNTGQNPVSRDNLDPSQYLRFGNPLSELSEDGEGCMASGISAAGLDPAKCGLNLQLWDGRLGGIAHQRGQFACLTESPATDQSLAPIPDERVRDYHGNRVCLCLPF